MLNDASVKDRMRRGDYEQPLAGLKPIHDWVRTFERTWNTRLDRLDDLLVELQTRRESP